MNNNLDKLKTTLGDAINQWISDNCDTDEWQDLDTYFGDHTAELMRDSAFNILLAQMDLTKYYKDNEMLEE